MVEAAVGEAGVEAFGGDALATELAATMLRGLGGSMPDADFDRLARRVHAVQYDASPRLRAWWDRRGGAPERVGHWSEIAPIPVEAFRDADFLPGAESAARVFHTSGTMRARPGRHSLSAAALALYRASMLPAFRHFLIPELEDTGEETRSALLPIVVQPPLDVLPHSSLAFMIDGVVRAFCASSPVFAMTSEGLDGARLRSALAAAERDGRPVLLIGTALGLVAAAEWLRARGEEFFLPSGSRAMETGGSKGSERVLEPAAVRAVVADAFGIPESHVVGEYGMTEACSQFYDDSLRTAWQASQSGCEWTAPAGGDDGAPRAKHAPPWARAIVCDPETLAPLPAGRTGVLRIVDLANRFTVSFLQTEDLAVARGEGEHGPGSAPFVLLGRASGAQARGCSLAAEEWLRASVPR